MGQMYTVGDCARREETLRAAARRVRELRDAARREEEERNIRAYKARVAEEIEGLAGQIVGRTSVFCIDESAWGHSFYALSSGSWAAVTAAQEDYLRKVFRDLPEVKAEDLCLPPLPRDQWGDWRYSYRQA